ncbi:hypothetical protein RDABS01_016162 [Bienertia sinuspersici]
MFMACSLALERRFEDAAEVLRDMLENSLKPDLLTYNTLLVEMCRNENDMVVFELLEEFKKTNVSIGERMYRTMLESLHFVDGK